MTNRVETYGWNSDRGPHSCDYLAPVVLAWLRELHPQKVIDLGAGNGALCRTMAEAGHTVVGIEPDAAGVEIARRQCPRAQIYQLGVDDAPDAVLRDHPDGFDIAVSTEVLEHLYAPRRLPAFAHAVLRKGGASSGDDAIPRLPEKPRDLGSRRLGSTRRPIVGRRTHQAIQSFDHHASFDRQWFCGKAVRRRGQSAAAVEKHDRSSFEERER